MVVAESVDFWRKIRDVAGDECWAHRVTLGPQTHVQTFEETALRRKPDDGSSAIATLGPGVLARIERRDRAWLKVSAERMEGWVKTADVWGGDIPSAEPRD